MLLRMIVADPYGNLDTRDTQAGITARHGALSCLAVLMRGLLSCAPTSTGNCRPSSTTGANSSQHDATDVGVPLAKELKIRP